jgi:hypothetical protein
VVFDPVCGPLFELAFRSLNWGGRHLVVGFVGGPIPALPANLPLMKGASLVGVDYRQFAQVFEAANALDRLEAFASRFGAAFYGVPPHADTVTLVRSPWTVPDAYPLGEDTVVPLRAGESVAWQLTQPR